MTRGPDRCSRFPIFRLTTILYFIWKPSSRSAGRVERHRIQSARGPVRSFHCRLRFGERYHLLADFRFSLAATIQVNRNKHLKTLLCVLWRTCIWIRKMNEMLDNILIYWDAPVQNKMSDFFFVITKISMKKPEALLRVATLETLHHSNTEVQSVSLETTKL